MNETVLTILEQLGGKMTFAMTGAKVHSYGDASVVLKLPTGKVKMFEVLYDGGSDLYTVRTYNTRYQPVDVVEDVGCEGLVSTFESLTGLYTRF